MIYRIRWSFIPAGSVILETVTESGSLHNSAAPLYHFSLLAKTNPVLDLIYKYWERVDSYTPLTLDHSLLYKKRQKGGTKRDIVVNFDWDRMQARYTNFGTSLAPIALVPGTLDPLSALYFIRKQHLAEGLIIKRPVTDGKKIVTGSVKVLKKETIRIHGISYDTFKLEPELKDVKGVFEKSKNAKMHIWITDDERRLVVKLKSKVVIGSFVAELVDIQNNIPQSDGLNLSTDSPPDG